MIKSHITFAKLISSPTDMMWSQAYTAGNLAAVVALIKNPEEIQEEEDEVLLSALGKDILSTFESEYFTLETKSLASIKEAMKTTTQKVDTSVSFSFLVTVILQDILYVFVYGKGEIFIKRKGKLGLLLRGKEEKELIAASGYIQDQDRVIIATDDFVRIVPKSDMSSAIDHINDFSEALSPIVHKEQHAAASAIAFQYLDPQSASPMTNDQLEIVGQPLEDIQEEESYEGVTKDDETKHANTEISVPFQKEETKESDYESFASLQEEKIHQKNTHFLPKHSPLPHNKRLMITIALIVVVVLVGSIFFALNKQHAQELESLYQTTVIPSQKKFDEGISLLDLNKTLAQQDFQQAQQMLKSIQDKFPKDSSQGKQINALLSQINSALEQASNASIVDVKQVDDIPYLTVLAKQTYATATQDDTSVYIADDTGVTKITKNNNSSKQIIKNTNAWKNIGAIGTYLGNFYILDTDGGILKYNSSLTKSNYFSGTSPDMSRALSLTIDGSIWILASDGTITKYTKGVQDSFTLKGLDKPFSSPTRIVTSADMNNVYVLDNGNKRVVIFDKNGNFVGQYQNATFAQSKELVIDEKTKTGYVLSGTTTYQFNFQ